MDRKIHFTRFGITAVLMALAIGTIGFAAGPARVVALGGDVTETIYALGQDKRLVCVDQTSLYPDAARKLPQVGYLRTLAAEGILSCKPDLILASENAGPKAVLDQLAAAHIRIVRISGQETPDAAAKKITAVAEALGVTETGLKLQKNFRNAMAQTRANIAKYKDAPRTVFLMAHGPGGAMAAGTGTAADAMLKLAHADNAATGFAGYKPLTAESAVSLAPDVIVIDDISLKSLGGLAAFRARPEIALTPAARNNRIVSVDTMYILGFGPRTPAAIATLAGAIHHK